jgi:hypothetical protein
MMFISMLNVFAIAFSRTHGVAEPLVPQPRKKKRRKQQNMRPNIRTELELLDRR